MSELEKTTIDNFISPQQARHNADTYNNINLIIKECMEVIQNASLQGKNYCDFIVPVIAKHDIIKRLEEYGYGVYTNLDNDKVASILILW